MANSLWSRPYSSDVGTSSTICSPIAHFTTHDLRRTVATGLVDLGFSFDVAAAVLGHDTGSKEVRTLIRHYVRSDLIDRKRNALTAWDGYLEKIVGAPRPPFDGTRASARVNVPPHFSDNLPEPLSIFAVVEGDG